MKNYSFYTLYMVRSQVEDKIHQVKTFLFQSHLVCNRVETFPKETQLNTFCNKNFPKA